MKNNFFSTLILLVLTAPGAIAQDKESGKKFWDNFHLRQAFESLDEEKEPAISSFTLPKDKANSFLINAGVSYNFIKVKHGKNKSTKMVFAPFFVLNRNTLIDNEQNNYKLGITQSYKIGNLDIQQKKLSYFTLNNSIEYQRDKIDRSHSLIITSYLSQINSNARKGGFFVNTYKDIGNNGFQYFFGWNTGLEYQNKFDATSDDAIGTTIRLYYNVELRIGKKVATDGDGNAALGKRLVELVASNTGRYDFVNTTNLKEDYLPLIKGEVVLYPTLSDKFSLGFSYNNGANPIAGLTRQDYFLLALKFKV